MKISCLQENLHKTLSLVLHSVGKESGLPILANILLKTEENFITLSATNLEIGVHATVRGKIEKEGAVAVDAKILCETIALLPKEKIELEVNDEHILLIHCENYSTKIRGINADDFPIIPTIERTQLIVSSAKDMRSALRGTLFTVCCDESRPELNGLFFQFKKNEEHLVLVGTDAYRLAKRVVSVKSDIQEDISLIIPQKTLHELERILQLDTEKELEMYISENQVLFIYDSVELLSKLITQTYPDYEQIIPRSFGTESIIDSKEFLKAIKISSIFSRSGLNDIYCSFKAQNGNKGEVCISASNASIGENITQLPIECKGLHCDVVLNHRYILEGLQSFDDERLFFGASDAQSPCVVQPPKRKDALYLIMPIRE